MGALEISFVLFSIFVGGYCTEFVPVYSWGTSTSGEKFPALHKISQDSFKDTILEQLKNDPYIVVFAEQTLSSEDFVQKNARGEIAFPELSALKKTSKVEYMPSVQNPIKALKHLDKDVKELSIESLKSKLNIPKTNILIVDLNDAKEDEHRFDMLKRHDSNIVSIFKKIVEERDNVLALYTAYHTSWIPAEDDMNTRKRRSLLADVNDGTFNTFPGIAMVYSAKTVSLNYKNGTITYVAKEDNKSRIITATVTGETTVELVLTFTRTLNDYTELADATLDKVTVQGFSQIYTPAANFSYHCSNQTFKTKKNVLTIPDFQIQVLYNKLDTADKFSDAYDCVGFTSAPIWSGLFVTFILLFIMTLGLTMMMDIKTMDRFDDAKGKTITINASD